jgi:hypothetical protein
MPAGRIRTRNPSKQAAADPCLAPRSHWDRLLSSPHLNILQKLMVVQVLNKVLNKVLDKVPDKVLNKVSLLYGKLTQFQKQLSTSTVQSIAHHGCLTVPCTAPFTTVKQRWCVRFISTPCVVHLPVIVSSITETSKYLVKSITYD